MESVCVKMPDMARKRKPKSGGSGSEETPKRSYSLFARIKPEVGKDLDDYLDSAMPRVDKGAFVEWAIVELLSRIRKGAK